MVPFRQRGINDIPFRQRHTDTQTHQTLNTTMGRNKTINKLRKAGVEFEITANGQNIVTNLLGDEQSATVRGIVDKAGVASYTHYQSGRDLPRRDRNATRPTRSNNWGQGSNARGAVATVNSVKRLAAWEAVRALIAQEVRFRQAFNKCVEELKTDERVRVWMEEQMN